MHVNLLSLERISNLLDTPIYIREVPIDSYLKMNGFLLSAACTRDQVNIGNNASYDEEKAKILASVCATMGWSTILPKAENWHPLEWLSRNPHVIEALPVLTLNELIGKENRLPRSMALQGSDNGPESVLEPPMNAQLLAFIQQPQPPIEVCVHLICKIIILYLCDNTMVIHKTDNSQHKSQLSSTSISVSTCKYIHDVFF